MEILKLVDDDEPSLATQRTNRQRHVLKRLEIFKALVGGESAVLQGIEERLNDPTFVAVGNLKVESAKPWPARQRALDQRRFADASPPRYRAKEPATRIDDLLDFGLFGGAAVKAPILLFRSGYTINIRNLMLMSTARYAVDVYG